MNANPASRARWLSTAECRAEYGLTKAQLKTLRESGRVRAVKATPKKWLYNREDLDRVFEPVPHDAEWRADLEYVEAHTA
jgi:hypothetical protein